MSYSDDEICSIVIDLGTYNVKSGFAGDENDFPKSYTEPVVGRLQEIPTTPFWSQPHYVGHKSAVNETRDLNWTNTIENRQIIDFENLERIEHHTFYNELRVAPEEHPVFLVHPINDSKKNIEQLTQIHFETFSVPAVYFGHQSSLALNSYGKLNGIVLDCGYEMSHSCAVAEGYALLHSTTSTDIGGKNLTNYMLRMLTNTGFIPPDIDQNFLANEIKHTKCNIALDYYTETSNTKLNQSYQLPDGIKLDIGEETIKCGEPLFEPSLLNLECLGIQNCITQSISKIDTELKQNLCLNTVLSGGTTMFPGFKERLEKELLNLDSNTQFTISSFPERNNSVFIGASILGSMSSFEQKWISKEEYDENGPTITHRKCY